MVEPVKQKMQLRTASRQAAKIRVGFSGTSGSGKTIGALMVAFGMTGDWRKIAVIDTENGSADLYDHLGPYQVLPIHTYSPEKYIEAIQICQDAGMEVIITDSMSHAWYYLLQVHDEMTGNKFQNWGPITKRYDALKNKILQSPCHFFTTTRKKQEYEVVKEEGRTQVVKLGLREINREGWEYELTLNFDIDQNHRTKSSKDRTGLFSGLDDPFILSEETGRKLKEWCNSGSADLEAVFVIAAIELNNVDTKAELNAVYFKYPQLHKHPDFMALAKEKQGYFNELVKNLQQVA